MMMTRQSPGFFITLYTVLLSVVMLTGACADAQAQENNAPKHSKHHHHKGKHGQRQAHEIYSRPQPASFIVDADTGRILESENADSLRYPASLTKMMTLYLAFDALKKGQLKLDQTIPVSEHASQQPQTNIALQPGSHIAVKDAILSIVVRSANDSAVTLGEALGGTEPAFAQKMSQKAHALGMKNTVFYNASGLPEPAQHTTARDMATLGLALRRDFPQYFPFFKTESFTYHGLTYIGHNHVMARYDGVDGIKTGFIRASGFNLVTSATRDNHHLVAVVLGGTTWKARDDKMIALLDKTFAQMALNDGGKNVKMASVNRKVAAFPVKAVAGNESAEGEGDALGDENKEAATQTASIAPRGNWGIQVGAFAGVTEASASASHAAKVASEELAASVVTITDSRDKYAVHRVRLSNLTQDQAESACHKLAALHSPCFVYKLD